jgi:hypothetical protein
MLSRRRSPLLLIVLSLLAGSVLAAMPAAAADDPVYYLPAPAGTALEVDQGNDERDFRTDAERYAFDFVAAEGAARFTVVAARGGTVRQVRMGFPGGSCDVRGDRNRPDCWREVNLVLIDHGDGTAGLYLHLRPDSATVRQGEVVSTGQPLAQAGSSGWTPRTGLQFQVQRMPAWHEVGRGGWFVTASLPVAFADADVLAQRPDGVPRTGDSVLSGNPGPSREPFRLERRPAALPASVPFEVDRDREVSAAYEADSPDGYGLRFAPAVDAPLPEPATASPSEPLEASAAASPDALDTGEAPATDEVPATDEGTIVRPLFGGTLAFAGCATGASASLGRMVAIELEVEDSTYLAVLGHLSEIEPSLLERDPAAAALIIGPNEFLGRYGVILPPGESPALECPAADATDPTADELFAAILRDASVTLEGEIVGGTPVSPEPLVGALAYEGFAWWRGLLGAVEMAEEAGNPRARWNARTPADGAHIIFGDPIRLVARVRDSAAITQVRFRAFYPGWARPADRRDFSGFDPRTSWSQLAVCLPPRGDGVPGAAECDWDGDRRDAVVTFTWDPSTAPATPSARWLPRAQPAMTRASTECVPVSLAVEVVDASGHVFSEIGDLPLANACDQRSAERGDRGRVLYLDPLVRPRAPAARGEVTDRAWPEQAPDALDGAIVWRDRSDNEDGFRVYARRSYLLADCSIRNTAWQRIDELPADTERYRPRHAQVRRRIEVPEIDGVPGFMVRWEYAVSAYNEAGETDRTRVGGFVGGGEAFCDPGLEPPPDL